MEALYGNEVSNLNVRRELRQFLFKNLRELTKRVVYTYFMRDFSLASAQLLSGALLFAFGALFGAVNWYHSLSTGEVASTGTVMIAVLPIILGFQLLLSFLSFDMANEPRHPIQPAPSLAAILPGLIDGRTLGPRVRAAP